MSEPAGIVMPFAGSTAPQGYLFCDGSAVSRSTYATLFAVIGTTYGSGDGSTTFNVPDISGRVVLGRSSSYSLGSTGGSSTVTLTTQELPSHSHVIPQHTHQNNFSATMPAMSHTVTQAPTYQYLGPAFGRYYNSSGSNRVYSGIQAIFDSMNVQAQTTLTVPAHPATSCTVTGGVSDCAAFGTTSAGGGGSHTNMQPYLAVNYIISTGEE